MSQTAASWLGRLAKAGALLLAAGFVVFQLHLKPLPVRTAAGTPGEVVREVMGTGTLEARTRASLGSRVQGRVISVEVDQNDTVTSGQLLVVLESADREREVALARAGEAAALAALDRLSAEVAGSRAVWEQAVRDHRRMRDLHGERAVSAVELEQAAERLEVAEADRRRALAALEEGRRRVTEAAQLLAYRRARLEETRIHAPFDGLVVHRHVDPGDFVVPGSTLVEVISPEVLWVSAWLDEAALQGIERNGAARVVFRAAPDDPLPGRVARWNREVDRETRQFLVDVLVEQLPANWSVGQRAEVYLEAGRSAADALTLPTAALQWRGGVPGVLAVEDEHVRWRPLVLGLQGGGRFEVLKGFSAGERAVLPSGGRAPKEGRRVRDESRPS